MLHNLCFFLESNLWNSSVGAVLIPEFTSKLLSCTSNRAFPLPKGANLHIDKFANELEFNKALYRELKVVFSFNILNYIRLLIP